MHHLRDIITYFLKFKGSRDSEHILIGVIYYACSSTN